MNKSVRQKVVDLIGEDGIAQAFAPIEEASGLPNAAYWSDEWLALEQEHCFRRAWVFAGAEAELPEPGDMKPIEIGGAPIIVMRDQDDEIHAVHNVCRHRGIRLLTERCNKPTLTCPYHAWQYGLDGKLRARPPTEHSSARTSEAWGAQ
ncbi:MAG: Rieske (2Fe-2S) protein, partial [Pseudomonadota bacterium]